jgi:hypothetical protein
MPLSLFVSLKAPLLPSLNRVHFKGIARIKGLLMELEENKKRELRVVNRDFSLGEY